MIKLVFKGKLTVIATGKPLPNAPVNLYERDIGKDDLLVEELTDAEGNYAIEWTAKKIDFFDDTAETLHTLHWRRGEPRMQHEAVRHRG